MKRMLTVWLLGSMGLMGSGWADEAALFRPDVAAPPAAQAERTRKVLDDYLAAKGWVEGDNTRSNGERFLVATGIGAIHAPKRSADYVEARVMAYEAAMARAKQQMLDFVAAKITTETMLEVHEGKQPVVEAPATPRSLWDKAKLLAHAKLDRLLQAAGPKEAAQSHELEAEKIARSSEAYRRLVRTTSRALLAGLQPFYVAENSSAGGAGEIGVVVVYSDKLAAMAYALSAHRDLPRVEARAPLLEQVGTSSDKLLSSFGVSQRIDEKGEYCLVAFGQCAPLSESEQSRLVAYRRARVQALGQLRSFAGELVVASDDLLQAQTAKEYEDLTTSYENASGYHGRITAKAETLGIAGAEQLERWSGTHPVNGHPVVGVVVVWSPSRAARAHQMAEQMKRNAQPGGACDDLREGAPPGAASPQTKAYRAAGVEGDLHAW